MRFVKTGLIAGYMLLVLGTVAVALAGGRRPYAPLSLLPAPAPVELSVVYSPEQTAWIEAAASAFRAGGGKVRGAAINVVLQSRDSRLAADEIATGNLRPTAWIASSQSALDRLTARLIEQGAQPLMATSGPDTPRPTVRTPLVTVWWSERADAIKPEQANMWQSMRSASSASDGWATYGHPEWGTFKWGHPDPGVSDAGLLVLALMASEVTGKTAGLTVADVQSPSFTERLREIEGAASFSEDARSLMNDMLTFGPSRFDVVVTYENIALQYLPDAERRGRQVRLVYPSANAWSDHPYSILAGAWVSDDQRAAARLFRDFLLSRAQQEQALSFGLRPVDETISLDSTASPFTRFADAGARKDTGPGIELPPEPVLDALTATWSTTR